MHDNSCRPMPVLESARGGTMTDCARGGRGWSSATARVAGLVATLAAAALLTAACGGGSSSTAGSPGAGRGRLAHALAFAHCMRSHGAPNFPDPNSSGGFPMKPSNSSSFNVPQAHAACAHLYPNEGKQLADPAQQAAQQRHALAFAACMRRQGIANFPDGWSGNVGQLISTGLDPSSPQLNAALTKCGF